MIEVTLIAPQAATRAKKIGLNVKYYYPLITETGLSVLKEIAQPPSTAKRSKVSAKPPRLRGR